MVTPAPLAEQLVSSDSPHRLFDDIVEVGALFQISKVNQYLAHGYLLLAVQAVAQLNKKSDNQEYVRRSVQYILGRTADVEHWDGPEPPVAPISGAGVD